MNAPFTEADRIEGYKAMRDTITPAARVRRRFLQGRTSKKDSQHTPLSALAAGADALAAVQQYITEKEPTLTPDSVMVSLVYVLDGKVTTRQIHSDPARISKLLSELMALRVFVCIGIIFLIQEVVDGDLYVGGWARPFIWSDETVTILGGLVEKKLDALKKIWGKTHETSNR